MLVFTHNTGSYAPYWYLRATLVFMCDIGIYAPYWYLHMILVFTNDTGIYMRCWYLYKVLVRNYTRYNTGLYMHALIPGIDISNAAVG